MTKTNEARVYDFLEEAKRRDPGYYYELVHRQYVKEYMEREAAHQEWMAKQQAKIRLMRKYGDLIALGIAVVSVAILIWMGIV